MNRLGKALLSLAAPLLIVLAFLGFFQRQGSSQLQALPAVFVGTGLILSGALARRRRRKRLLSAMRKTSTEVT